MAAATNIPISATTTDFVAAINAARASLNTFDKDLNGRLVNSFRALDREQRQFNQGLGRVQEQLARQAQESARRIAATAQSFKSVGQGLSTYLTLPLLAAGAAAFKTYADIDALKRGLAAVATTTDTANQQFERLRDIARLPGIGLEEAVKGSVRLQAVGFTAKAAEAAMRQFGNAIALTGGGKFQLDTVTTQLGQMVAKSKVLAQDLKPIIEAAPAAAGVIKKIFGTVDSEEISAKLKAQGKDSKFFIDLLTTELSKLERVSGGPKNAIENLGDSLKIASYNFVSVADKTLGLTDKLNGLGKLISHLANGFKDLGGAQQGGVLGLVGIAAALGPVSIGIGSIIKLFTSLTAKTGALRIGFAALTGPIGLTVLALAAVGTAAYAVYNLNAATKSTYSSALLLNEANKSVAQSVSLETSNLSALLIVAKDETRTKEQRRAAIEKINLIAPEYLGNISLENIGTAKSSELIRDYVKSIELKARAQFNAGKLAEAESKLEEERSKKLSDRVGILDRLASAGKNLFTSDGKSAVEAEVNAKATERHMAALSDAQKTVDFYRGSLQLAVDAQTRLGKAPTVGGKSGPDFLTNNVSGIAALKAELKAAKEEVQSIITTKGIDAVPADKLARVKELAAKLKEANDAVRVTKPKSEKSDLTQLAALELGLKLLNQEIQTKRTLGIDIPAETFHELGILEAQIKRIKGEQEKSALLKPKGDSLIRLNSESEADRGGFFRGALSDRAGAELPGLSTANPQQQYRDKVEQIRQAGQQIAGAYFEMKQTIKNAAGSTAIEMSEGLGQVLGGIATGQTKILSGLISIITDFLSAYLSKIAQAKIVAGSVLLATGLATLDPFSIKQGASMIQAGGLIKVASGVVKGLAGSLTGFAQGGVFTKPSVGLFGEYSGASMPGRAEIATPQDLMAATFRKELNNSGFNQVRDNRGSLSQQITVNHEGEFTIRGNDLKYVLSRVDRVSPTYNG